MELILKSLDWFYIDLGTVSRIIESTKKNINSKRKSVLRSIFSVSLTFK